MNSRKERSLPLRPGTVSLHSAAAFFLSTDTPCYCVAFPCSPHQFSVNAQGQLTSAVLDLEKSHACGDSYEKFRLQLRDDVTFSNGEKAGVQDLLATLRRRHASKRNPLPETRFEVEADAVICHLRRPDALYLRRFLQSTTPFVSEKRDAFGLPLGSGPYRPKEWHKDHIILEAIDGKVTGDFHWVEFSHSTLRPIPPFERSLLGSWVARSDSEMGKQILERGYHKQQGTSFANWKLCIRWPHDEERKRLAQSLVPLREALCREIYHLQEAGTEAEISDSLTLPGLPGHVERMDFLKSPSAEKTTTNRKPTIPFLYDEMDSTRRSDLQKFLERHASGLPFEIVPLRAENLDDYIKFTKSGEPMIYEITSSLTRLDALASEGLPFFGINDHDMSPIPGGVPGSLELLEQVKTEPDAAKRDALLRRLNELLVSSGYFLPLCRTQGLVWVHPRIDPATLFDEAGSLHVDRARLK